MSDLQFDALPNFMEDLNENVKAIITVGDLYAMSGGDGTQIIFT